VVFVIGVIWIVNELGALVDEDGLGFLEAHAMFLEICGRLANVPLEAKCAHAHSITTL
jgi:hypothetical protein